MTPRRKIISMELSNRSDLQRPAISTYHALGGGREGRNTFRVRMIMLSGAFGQSGNCLWYNRHFRKLDIEAAVMRTR